MNAYFVKFTALITSFKTIIPNELVSKVNAKKTKIKSVGISKLDKRSLKKWKKKINLK